MELTEIECKTACNKLKSGQFPFNWDLNIYRGCQHGCKYCYALYSHSYLGERDYFDNIYVKTNVAQRLDEQLSKSNWKNEVVNIGSVTDSYQPIEKKYKIMRDVWEVMIKHKNPCIISTKSDLILRDLDLIERLAKVAYVSVASTITCMDEDVAKRIEPLAVPSKCRFDALKEIAKTKASIGLHIMPTIPFLTDNEDNLRELYSNGKEIGVNYVITSNLNLRGKTKDYFLSFIKQEYPDLFFRIKALYNDGGCSGEYKRKLYEMVTKLEGEYKLNSDYNSVMERRRKMTEMKQISFFE